MAKAAESTEDSRMGCRLLDSCTPPDDALIEGIQLRVSGLVGLGAVPGQGTGAGSSLNVHHHVPEVVGEPLL